MPADLQAKLLRTLQEHTVLPIGAEEEVPVDVRVVASSNRDIHDQLASGQFRQDLFYRLVAFPIAVPALREHPEDVPELAYHFLSKHRDEAGRQEVNRIADDAMELLRRHPWPGNIRQLENAIYNALLTLSGGTTLTLDALPETVQNPAAAPAPLPAPAFHGFEPPLPQPTGPSLFHDPKTGDLLPLRAIEELAFHLALEESGGNATRAAKALGVARATLYRRLKSKKSA
jgi:transcriptional regulator with PAS, ATPase and Fis domain